MRRLLLAALLALAAAPAAAQELGRLFFTPEQRSALDARRKARLPDKPAAVAASPSTRLDGLVVRSGGRTTVFVDGEAITEGLQPDGSRVRRGRAPGEVSIGAGDGARRQDLRVGESMDRATGEVRDVIGDGEIKVERRGAQGR